MGRWPFEEKGLDIAGGGGSHSYIVDGILLGRIPSTAKLGL